MNEQRISARWVGIKKGDYLEMLAPLPRSVSNSELFVVNTSSCNRLPNQPKILFLLGEGGTLLLNESGIVQAHDPGQRTIQFRGSNNWGNFHTVHFSRRCSGLEKAAKEMGEYILQYLEEYDRIYMIGHSKSGLMFLRTLQLLQDQGVSIKKIELVTVSSPFSGTVVASLPLMKIRLPFFLFPFYKMIFSNHNVDQDLTPDSAFIRTLSEGGEVKNHLNVISSLRNFSEAKTPIDKFLFVFGKLIRLDGDGIVSKYSQSWKGLDSKTVHITASHATSLFISLELLYNLVKKQRT